MSTITHQYPVGLLMTVWNVDYVWHDGERGDPPSAYYGPTPDEPAHAEITSAVLIHVGPNLVSAGATYLDNGDSFTGANAAGADLWEWIQDHYEPKVIGDPKLHRAIARWEGECKVTG